MEKRDDCSEIITEIENVDVQILKWPMKYTKCQKRNKYVTKSINFKQNINSDTVV